MQEAQCEDNLCPDQETIQIFLLPEDEETNLEDPLFQDLEQLEDTVLFHDGIFAYGITQRGSSHLRVGALCQDYSGLRQFRHGGRVITLAAAADGVGSCALSHLGASTAVSCALRHLEKRLLKSPDEHVWTDAFIGGILREAFFYALEEIEALTSRMEQLPFNYFTTLTLCVYTGKELYFGHVGDDGVVVLLPDGTYELVTIRHKGQEVNSVYPLQAGSEIWQFGRVDKPVWGFAIATDGILDQVVRSEALQRQVYAPFMDRAFYFEAANEQAVARQRARWQEYLSGKTFRARVNDDITLVIVGNYGELCGKQPALFDREKWDMEGQAYYERVNEALYGRTGRKSEEPGQVREKPREEPDERKEPGGRKQHPKAANLKTESREREKESLLEILYNICDNLYHRLLKKMRHGGKCGKTRNKEGPMCKE